MPHCPRCRHWRQLAPSVRTERASCGARCAGIVCSSALRQAIVVDGAGGDGTSSQAAVICAGRSMTCGHCTDAWSGAVARMRWVSPRRVDTKAAASPARRDGVDRRINRRPRFASASTPRGVSQCHDAGGMQVLWRSLMGGVAGRRRLPLNFADVGLPQGRGANSKNGTKFAYHSRVVRPADSGMTRRLVVFPGRPVGSAWVATCRGS